MENMKKLIVLLALAGFACGEAAKEAPPVPLTDTQLEQINQSVKATTCNDSISAAATKDAIIDALTKKLAEKDAILVRVQQDLMLKGICSDSKLGQDCRFDLATKQILPPAAPIKEKKP